MFPAVMLVQREVDLHEWPPLRALGLAHQVQARLERRAVRLARIARDARADNVFPGRRAAAVARDDVVEVQIFPVENLATVLARILVAFENIMPRELHFLLRHAVVHEEQDYFRHADAERNRVDGIVVRRVGGDIAPLLKIESAERAVGVIHHHLRLALEE